MTTAQLCVTKEMYPLSTIAIAVAL